MFEPWPYYLGLPAWADPAWRGPFLPTQGSALAAYAQYFNTVEGNTSFYQIPDAKTVAAWNEAVSGLPFRFSFKLPREVTHQRYPDWDALWRFLRVVEPLFANLGPLLVQLPEHIGPQQMGWMNELFRQLPDSFQHVIEVRHPQFCSQPELLEPLLDHYQLGRVIMDTRALFQGDRSHPEVQDALRKKPDLPIVEKLYHGLFYLRLILHPDRLDNQRYIDHWVQSVACYLQQGQACFVMIHCANNRYAPELALAFHQRLREELGSVHMPPLTAWAQPQQNGLF